MSTSDQFPYEPFNSTALQSYMTKVDILLLDLLGQLLNLTARLELLRLKTRLMNIRLDRDEFRVNIIEDIQGRNGMPVLLLWIIMIFFGAILFCLRRRVRRLEGRAVETDGEAEGGEKGGRERVLDVTNDGS